MKGKVFTAQEVQAILNKSKVMFREVVKNNLLKSCYKIGSYDSFTGKSESEMMPCNHSWAGKRIDMICSDCWKELLAKCPYQVGQKIFCKESFLQKLGSTQLPSGEHETFFTSSKVEYVADGAQERWDNPNVFYPNWWKKRPAQHMKQEHSRLTLEITDVKVERLKDISEEDAISEGLPLSNEFKDRYYTPEGNYATAKIAFMRWWNATHKKPEEKFEANPFVFVYQFETIK